MGLDEARHVLLLAKWPVRYDTMIASNGRSKPLSISRKDLLNFFATRLFRLRLFRKVGKGCESQGARFRIPDMGSRSDSLALTLFGVVHLSKPNLDLG